MGFSRNDTKEILPNQLSVSFNSNKTVENFHFYPKILQLHLIKIKNQAQLNSRQVFDKNTNRTRS